MTDPESLGKVIGIGTLAITAGKEIVTAPARRIGVLLERIVNVVATHYEENLDRVVEKWKAARGDRPITDEEIQKTLPLLRFAAMQSDEDLQARWAALLEHTATSSKALPGFAQTLSELTPEEARFLDRLYDALTQNSPIDPDFFLGRSPMEREALINIYDLSIDTRLSSGVLRARKSELRGDQLKTLARLDEAELIINDLERHGIIAHYQVTQPENYYRIPHQFSNYVGDSDISGKLIPMHDDKPDLRTFYSLSAYGVSFIRAVSPSKVNGV